jgi:hypothetical protein
MQLARSNAQRLLLWYTIEVCTRSQQGAIPATPHIIHDAPYLPLYAIQIHCAALVQ